MNIEINTKESKDHFSKYPIKDFSIFKKKIVSIEWNNDGTKLAVSNIDGCIRILSFIPKVNSNSFNFEKFTDIKNSSIDPIVQVAWCEKSSFNLCYITSNEKSIRLVSIKNTKNITIEKIKYNPKSVQWKLNKVFVLSKEDDFLQIFNVDFPNIELDKSINLKSKISSFKIDTLNNVFIALTDTNLIHIYDCENFDNYETIPFHNNTIYSSLSINKDNSSFATGGNDALITLWSTSDYISYKAFKKTDYSIKEAEISYNNKYVFAVYDEPALDIFNINTEECVFSINKKMSINYAAWHPERNIIVLSAEDKVKDEGTIYVIGY